MSIGFDSLEPQAVWHHFQQIMKSPRPSGHEGAVREYIKGYAAECGVECIEDSVGNLILRVDATQGMESRKGIILQAHLDMVPQKELGLDFDFLRDPIEGYIDGDWVRARGTTLGADNGLGVAAALAVIGDRSIKHPALEILLTADEEQGMEGAFGLADDALTGDILLNLDTEVEGELVVGCAGGLDLVATFEHEMSATPQGDYVARRLEIRGLRGGHSGLEIAEQRGNANKLLFRLLRLTKIEILIAAIKGGSLKNAIPREAYADILIHTDDLELFEEQVAKYRATIAAEYVPVESDIEVTLSEIEYPEEMIEESAASCIVWSIAGCMDGVYRMSNSIDGLVQSSSNLAIVESESGATRVTLFLRSSSESEKVALADSIASVFELADAEVVCAGSHPGWLPNLDSPILNSIKQGYRELFGCEADVRAVHAGLECGAIGALYPNLDMISFGPTILSPHSPAERLQISSVSRFYKLLIYAIENSPQR